MKIGCCVPRERLAAAMEASFEYGELTVVENLRPLEDDATWAPIRRELEAAALPIEATNVFFPGDWHLIGPEADPAATRAYVDVAVRRAAGLGVAVMVFGSGRARTVPPGYPQEQALRELTGVLQVLGESGARYGVTIVLEPLRRAETNLVYTVAEATELVRPLANPRVAVLADSYHMAQEDEPLASLPAAGDLLQHVHVSEANRDAPRPGGYDYAAFLAQLRQAGYQGRISVECRWQDWEQESPVAVALLRRLALSAGD
jgi:sugar phosphate isomerase/epimerase